MAEPVDYTALAKQAGAISSQPAHSAAPVDYAALARQSGAISSAAAGTPAFAQPEGSAFGRFMGGVWNTINPGPLLKLVATAIPDAMAMRPVSANTVTALSDVVQSHIDQFQKAKTALDKGEHVEAFGHLLATGLPFIGPAAANAAETMGGEAPVMDKYGNVVKQGKAPNIAGGLGQAAGLVGSVVAPEYIVKGVKAAVPAELPTVPSSLNPVQQSAIEFLKSKGVSLKAGTVTGNRFLKAAEATTAASPLGSIAAGEAMGSTEAGLTRVAGKLADDAHPVPVAPETAGRNVSRALDKKIEGLNFDERGAYEKAWQHVNEPQFTYDMPVSTPKPVPVLDRSGKPTGELSQQAPVMKKVNMPVDVRDIKDSLKQVYDDMQWMPAAERSASAGYQAVKRILEGDDFIPAPAAERGLSGLKTLARVENPNLRNVGQGIAARIIPDLQGQVDAAVAYTGDEAFRGLQSGRALHANKMELAGIADNLRQEPVQAFQQMTWKNDTGIDFLRKIDEHAPDTLPQVGRAFVTQLFDKATQEGGFAKARSILNDWRSLGPETKKLLFRNPELRQSLDDFFQGAAMVGDNPNPSGTAIVTAATSLNPLRWLAGAAGAKLLFTPRGVALLTESLKPEVVNNPVASQVVKGQIYRMLGRTAAVGVNRDAAQ